MGLVAIVFGFVVSFKKRGAQLALFLNFQFGSQIENFETNNISFNVDFSECFFKVLLTTILVKQS